MKKYSYISVGKEQLIIEGILNYINSPKLVNHNSEITDEKYDYKVLNQLYNETLNCFNFRLIVVKEYLDNQEPINGLLSQINIF